MEKIKILFFLLITQFNYLVAFELKSFVFVIEREDNSGDFIKPVSILKTYSFLINNKKINYNQFNLDFLSINHQNKIINNKNIFPIKKFNGNFITLLYLNSENIIYSRLNINKKNISTNFVIDNKKKLFIFKQSLSNKFLVASNFKEEATLLFGEYKKQINTFIDFSINNKIFSTRYLTLLGYNILKNSVQVKNQISFLLRNSIEIGLYTNYFNSFFYSGVLFKYLNKFISLKTYMDFETNFIDSLYFNFDFLFSVNIGAQIQISLYKISDKLSELTFLDYQKEFDPYYEKDYKNISAFNFQLLYNNFLFSFNVYSAFYDYFLSINLFRMTNFTRPDLYFYSIFSWNLKRFIFKFDLDATLFTTNSFNWGTSIFFNEISLHYVTLNFGLLEKAYNIFSELQFLIDTKINLLINKNSILFLQTIMGATIKHISTPLIYGVFNFELSTGLKILF